MAHLLNEEETDQAGALSAASDKPRLLTAARVAWRERELHYTTSLTKPLLATHCTLYPSHNPYMLQPVLYFTLHPVHYISPCTVYLSYNPYTLQPVLYFTHNHFTLNPVHYLSCITPTYYTLHTTSHTQLLYISHTKPLPTTVNALHLAYALCLKVPNVS